MFIAGDLNQQIHSRIGKKPCLSLRELEKQIGYGLDNRLDPMGKNITVNELVERYLKTKVNNETKYKEQLQIRAKHFGKREVWKCEDFKNKDVRCKIASYQNAAGGQERL